MNVRCTGCDKLYRLPTDKVEGRTVRVTCRSCGQVFRVKSVAGGPTHVVPDDIARRDFRDVGLNWQLRGTGGRRTFRYLGQLEEWLQDGEAGVTDQVSWDRSSWQRLDAMGDREAWFFDCWQRAKRGEISTVSDPFDDTDQPTQVFVFRVPDELE